MMRATKHWQEKQRKRELGRRLIQFIVNVGWDPESSGEEERMSDERGNVEDLGPLLFDSEFYNERSPREDTSATPEVGTRPGGGGIHATRPGGGGIRSGTEGVSCHDDSEDDAEWTAPGEEWEMSGGAEMMGLETSRDDEEAVQYMQQRRLAEEIQDGKQGNCCFRSLAAEAGWGSEKHQEMREATVAVIRREKISRVGDENRTLNRQSFRSSFSSS